MTIPTVTLNDGHKMPAIGLGTYQIRGGAGLDQILAAIQDGYRSLDSATNYDNEGIVAKPSAALASPVAISSSARSCLASTTATTTRLRQSRSR